MAFDPNFLDQLRDRVNLGELIGRRVRLVRRGREFLGLCPFHQEKTPSFNVVEEKGFYHCFGCGAHGDAIGWIMRMDGLAFPEAVERLAAEVGLPVPVTSPEERARAARQASLYAVMEAACLWFQGELGSARGKAGLDYLRRRGFDDDTIARYRLGFAPDGRTALRAALTKGPAGEKIDEAQLVEAGLLIAPEGGGTPYDRFRGRVMFPIADARGRVIAFGGRVLAEAEGTPKYLNSPDTPLFHKGRVLYGLAQAREAARKSGRAIVCEGYTDVIALGRAGIAEAVAPLGTALTESHLELLWKLAPEPILCFDGDAAGRRAAGRALERAMPLLKPGLSLRFALLPPGEDPDSLVRRQGASAVEAILGGAVALDQMVWELETAGAKLDTPERIAGVEKRLEDRALAIADRKVQLQYLGSLRRRLRELVWTARRRGPPPPRPQDIGVGFKTGLVPLDRRREQLLLLCVLNHPELLDDFAEVIAEIELSDATLDKLRQEILKVSVQVSGLDMTDLRSHLREAGLAGVLDELEGRDVRGHDAFARPGITSERARRGLARLLIPFREREWRVQFDEAERAWRESQSEANWSRMQALKAARQHAEAEIAAVDDDVAGFGESPPTN